MEFSTICRVCMQPISLEYIDLDTPFNETTYFECFNYCTKLEAKSSDKLPKTICISCANLLQTAYDFICAAAEADRLFRDCFDQLDDCDDAKFIIEEDDVVSKETIVPPTLSVHNETPKDYIIHNNQLNFEESAESFQDEESQEDAVQLTRNAETQSEVKPYRNILAKEDTELVINKEANHNADIEDTRKDTELSVIEQTDVSIANAPPTFEIIETIEVEKQEDTVQLTSNTKLQIKVKKFTYMRPKEETVPKILVIEKDTASDLIEPNENLDECELATFEIEETFDDTKDPFVDTSSTNQQSDGLVRVLTLNKDTKTKIKCHICQKKIRKNYADHMNQHTGNKAYKCDKCDDSFFTLKQFKLHKAQNHKKFRDAWFCNKCGEAFESGAKLNTHQVNDHSNKTSGFCLTCGESFSDQDALEQHVKDEHWSRRCPVECTHCKKKYQLHTLPMHVRYAHSDVVHASENKQFTCKYCFENCEGGAVLEEHIKKHKGKNNYTCATCGKDFKGKRVFDKHKSTMHPEPNVNPDNSKCNKCDFTTNDLRLLVKHKKKHYTYPNARSAKYLCAYCPKRFFNIKPLNDHEDYQHGEKKTAHVCDLCDKKFYSNFKLQTHKKSAHGNDRPFMCKECPKAFKLKPQLLQHEKNHYGRTIKCPHCDKKFVQPCYLRVHLRTHTNELPFECHLCDKKFAIKVRLTYHLEKHEGIVRKCEHCPKSFDNMAKLRIHRFEHLGYPYVCDHCEENHHKRESFVRHMRRFHGIIMTEADVEENRLRNMKNFYRKTKVKNEPDLEM